VNRTVSVNDLPTLREFVSREIRLHKPTLSTGAYGDEGEIMMMLDGKIVEGPVGHLELDFRPANREEVTAILSFMGKTLKPYVPKRFRLSKEQVDTVIYKVQAELTRMANRRGQSLVRIEDKIVRTVYDRAIISLQRGDELWKILFEADILADLGPFIRER
jgi:hypothetical protein